MERFGPTRRGGPVFRWLGEPLAIDLVNTVMVVREGETVDLLAEQAGLERWLEAESSRLGNVSGAAAHADEIRALRDAAHDLFTAVVMESPPPARALDHINRASRGEPVAPQLGDDLQLSAWHGRSARLPHLLATLARCVIELVTDPTRKPLQICRAPSCGMFYLGTKRWCCAACGNRARAARHYETKRARR
jgi:predicted RNA-binding Zn ribbon-like protein